MINTKTDAARVAEILRQYERRLKTYLGEKRTDQSDLFLQALLPVLESIVGQKTIRANRRKLGQTPASRYHLPNPNKTIRKLCLEAADLVLARSGPRGRIRVPQEFLLTHCVTCPCGVSFLVQRSDAKFCSQACQKKSRRRANCQTQTR